MRILILLLSALIFTSCHKNSKKAITKIKDYDHFLEETASVSPSKHFQIWNSKIKPDSMQLTSFGIVAREYDRHFANSGNIEYLKKAEHAL
ncbi:MAG: hypothetical protein KJN76_03130, partial [Eudoraea sp.]|nr:hypothetical protein [Eudoraea sp.]